MGRIGIKKMDGHLYGTGGIAHTYYSLGTVHTARSIHRYRVKEFQKFEAFPERERYVNRKMDSDL